MKKIYLDHAATTPVASEVVKAMTPYFTTSFGNASSIHSFGREAREAVDESRRRVAKFLNCEPQEIIFTSGGTESNNLAIRGLIVSQCQMSNVKCQNGIEKIIPHVITTQIEHHAVLNTVKELEKQGIIEATYVGPDQFGIVSADNIKSAIRNNTVLVSVMYVNNEIGTVQPIREIGKLIQRINLKKQDTRNKIQTNIKVQMPNDKSNPKSKAQNNEAMKQWNNRIYFHTDAVQAAEYYEMNVKALHVDMLTFTAHKIYGPKGVGVLYVKKGTPLKSQFTGGDQEYRKRAGTENVPGIVGLGKAAELSQKLKVESKKLVELRDKLIDGILRSVKGSRLNGSREQRSPGNVNISVENAEGEAVLLNLDMEGIAASSGSACTSGALEPSHVLLAIGIPAEIAHGSIRFTLGRHTTEEEIDRVLEVFPKIVEKVRSISPFK